MKKERSGRRGRFVQKVRMADVARVAGVSSMTVSNAFKFPEKVIPETRQRIMDTAAELGYIPNMIAGNLASGRSRVVAAVTRSIRNSDFADMLMGMEAELGDAGYHLIVSVVEDSERETSAIRALMGRQVEGLVLVGVNHTAESRQILTTLGVPVVETWDIDGPFIDLGVGFDTRKASNDACQLLVARGCKKIGCIAYDTPGVKRFEDRVLGYRDSMEKVGLRSDLVVEVPPSAGFSGGATGLKKLLELDGDLDGIFGITDVLAAGAAFRCMERGISVPEQIALVGFGDYELSAALPRGLSSVRIPGEIIGRVAAKEIVARNDGRAKQEPIIDVGYSIVLRGSC